MKAIRQALEEFALRSPPRLRYLIGISGGLDSVALLDLLHTSGFKNLVVCHLNHGLRGRESGQDAAFVRRLARSYNLPFESEKTDISKLAKRRGRSLEDAGRLARLALFSRASKSWRCRRVILAHHADDQIETVLMNLGRGAGSGGFRGMRPESVIEAYPLFSSSDQTTSPRRPNSKKVKTVPLTLLRPFLNVWRRDLEIFTKEHNLAFREDLSNSDPAYLRNRIRHQLIPTINEIFRRDTRPAILRAAALGDEENAFLDSLTSEAYASSANPTPVPELSQPTPILYPNLTVADLRALPLALQRRVLHRWLTELEIPDIGFRDIENLRVLIHPSASLAKANLPGDYHARRKAGRLFITHPSGKNRPTPSRFSPPGR